MRDAAPIGAPWIHSYENTDPSAYDHTYCPPIGGAQLLKHELATLLLNAREQDAPFIAGTVLIGMNEPLTQEQADYLNELYPGSTR